MANKYIIHGATFNGDGTTSAAAASDGGVGAWNTITYFTGTAPAFGTLVGGDTVYIRSKSAAGADLTIAMAANTSIGSSAAGATTWITWTLDAGTVWPGIDGTLSITNSAFSLTAVAHNRFVAKRRGAMTYVITGSSYLYSVLIITNGEFVGFYVNSSGQTGTSGIRMSFASNATRFINCDFDIYRDAFSIFISGSFAGALHMVGCNIYLANRLGTTLIDGGSQSYRLHIEGCNIYGAGVESGAMVLFTASTGAAQQVKVINTRYPAAMRIHSLSTAVAPLTDIASVLCDTLFGSENLRHYGYTSSRNDGFFPTLNATLPDANLTPWSYYLYLIGATEIKPFHLSLVKYCSPATGIKTLTLNLLHADTISTLTRDNTWAVVSYTDDATGNILSVDSRDTGNGLESSTASWSSTSYGAIALAAGKKQIQMATPTSVRTGTNISITFLSFVAPAGVNDIMFLCPDVVLA